MPTTTINTNEFEHISLTNVLTSITSHTEQIKTNLNTVKNNLATIKSDINVLKIRGDNENLGIYINPTIGGNSLQRAVTMIGVKNNNAIADVSYEMNNPTPLP